MNDARPVCPSRESTYVPWSFGEVYQCTQCGHRARQAHNLKPIRLGQSGEVDYASIYPMLEHKVEVSLL